MNAQLQELVTQARSGEAEPFQRLVEALRSAAADNVAVLLESALSPEEILRRAATQAARERSEPEVLQAMAALARDADADVRKGLARSLGAAPSWLPDELVGLLLRDLEAEVRFYAAQGARGRTALEVALVAGLSRDDDEQVRLSIARSLASANPAVALPALLAALAQDDNRPVAEASAGSIESHLDRLNGYPETYSRPRLTVLENAQQRLAAVGPERYPRLTGWLADRVAHDVDPERLRNFGTLLTEDAVAGRLPRAHGVNATCAVVKQALFGKPPRAAVLLGEPGSGKTAIVQELVHQLREDPEGPWHVLRVSPSDLMAGTQFLGEWQTRLRDLVNAIRLPRRIVLYIPNLEELSHTGRSMQNDSNLGTALAPHIERGEVVILGETSPEAYRSGLGAVASLRRLFHTIDVREASVPETRAILRAVRDEESAPVSDAVLDRLMELADFYLPGIVQPGRSIGLLRRMLGSADRAPSAAMPAAAPISERDVLLTLSTSTGIPIDFLDDNVPLDRAQVRAFFEARVMGQPEAVDAVVNLAALIKAGLTDPGKPFGVLLFVGPTGVGKTEMARSLAELLFGDPGRMIRLDMSEFANYEAHERLLGWGHKPGVLTGPVRERPFSVLLFDEIEKAHPTVFDLCLQLFDAGRLSDLQGRTTDFRRTIIIMTSNIGSTVNTEGGFGFQTQPPKPFDNSDALRELGHCFRPEFLNRLDRIVSFRPLEAETAEKIARRDVARVLERSGIARRRLTVDVDPGVIALLLREGYSLAFGARPLKRTVERLVLQPVAWAIAADRVLAGSVLRLIARSGRVDVEVAPPEGDSVDRPPESGELAPRLPAATATGRAPLVERVRALEERVQVMREQAQRITERKSELVGQTAGPNFWADRAAARSIHDDIFRLDGILTALAALEQGVREQAEHLTYRRLTERDLSQIKRRVETLESQAQHVAFLVGCQELRDLADAYLCLASVPPFGPGLEAVAKMAQMYQGLAQRRNLEVTVLDDHQGGNPWEDSISLQLTGAGAYALLTGEGGLHQFLRKRGEQRHEGRRSVDRDLVRVEVLRVPAGDVVFAANEVRIESRPLRSAPGRLLSQPKLEVQLLHVGSMISVRAWTDVSRATAVERLTPLLRARVDAAQATAGEAARSTPPVVRRYVLGPSTQVRDLRVGRTTGRLDLVLKGHLDPFLTPPQSGLKTQ